MTDSPATSLHMQDGLPSHSSSLLVLNPDTCKIVDVHLALNKPRDTSSASKAVDKTKGMKFYFKSVK